MFQSISSRHHLPARVRGIVAAVALLGILQALLPVSTALAVGDERRIDRRVQERMNGNQPVRVILVAGDSLNFLEGEMHRLGIARPLRVPIAHGLSAELTPDQIR